MHIYTNSLYILISFLIITLFIDRSLADYILTSILYLYSLFLGLIWLFFNNPWLYSTRLYKQIIFLKYYIHSLRHRRKK